ncbi:MAG TPA: zinc-binding dehydrogenase [Cyclobacteriaceae bacterium]|jgi:NADPH2:quinone reductase
MKAYLLTRHGKPEVLKIHEVPEPQILPDKVKIRVMFIGINYAEILSRRGLYRWAPKRPYIPGLEGMGEVIEVGSKVEHVKPGQKVIFGSQFGSYAEVICADMHLVFPVFSQFALEENGAFLVNFLTAWVALVKLGKIKSADKVLIQAAGGGVGTAAVQIAKGFGCDIFGTIGSDHKIELIRNLGVAHPINYNKVDFYQFIKEKVEGVDLVLEVVGGDVFKKSLDLLNPFGRLVVIGYAGIPFKKFNPYTWWLTWKHAPKVNILKMVQRSYSISGSHLGYLSGNSKVAVEVEMELRRFVQEKNLKPVIGKIFDFDHLPDAHAFMESRQSTGKLLVKV